MKKAIKQSLLVFFTARIILTVWAFVVLNLVPAPMTDNPMIRPHVSQPHFTEGITGTLLGPWQRWDTNRYMRIAEVGYTEEINTVFPPLYPFLTRMLGSLWGGDAASNLWAAAIISNLAFIGLLIMLFIVTEHDLGQKNATRALIYLTFFPAGFFLLAPYSESLFIFFALASIWATRHNGRFWLAGLLGFLAALTRLTGWILVIPLAYEWWIQWGKPYLIQKREHTENTETHPAKLFHGLIKLAAVGLPGLGTAVFLIWREAVGFPSLAAIYQRYWQQIPGIPGTDLIRAIETMFFGGSSREGEFTLWIDFFCFILLAVTTYFVFRRLNVTYGLYSIMLLLFMLLPVSDYKPLNAFSRYALAFFPTFIILAQAGKNPWVNRSILYPSFILYLYFSGQFFIWGWVA